VFVVARSLYLLALRMLKNGGIVLFFVFLHGTRCDYFIRKYFWDNPSEDDPYGYKDRTLGYLAVIGVFLMVVFVVWIVNKKHF
jgi:hypothetical protein